MFLTVNQWTNEPEDELEREAMAMAREWSKGVSRGAVFNVSEFCPFRKGTRYPADYAVPAPNAWIADVRALLSIVTHAASMLCALNLGAHFVMRINLPFGRILSYEAVQRCELVVWW